VTAAQPLRHLKQPDGTVVIPARLADDVLRRLQRDMFNEARSLGVLASPAAQRLLYVLDDAARQHREQTEKGLQIVATLDETEKGSHLVRTPGGDQQAAGALTVREMADRMGCSTQYVRHLLATGKLAGRKSGRVWIVYTGQSEAA
jgi:excisionase family DNA binding protein